MDGIELLYLLFVGLYFLFGVFRKQNERKRKAAQASGEIAPGKARAPTPFQEFMEQMEEAIREANGEPPATPEREVVIEVPETPEAIPSPMPVPTSRPVVAAGSREPEFHAIGGFERESGFEGARRSPHEEHGFGLDQPFSEERFEQLARGRDITEHAHAPLAPLDPPARESKWSAMLQHPESAQDAFVLAQIFDGPWRPRKVKRIGHP